MKYALLLVLEYENHFSMPILVKQLPGALIDLEKSLQLCKEFKIENKNITIVTDIRTTSIYSKGYNIKYNPYPDDIFICTEIAQFIENTIKYSYSFDSDNFNISDEIFFYISCHGNNIYNPLSKKEEQGIVLTSDNGTNKKYLLSKDLFNL
jgi:hypothetical protein